MGLEHPFLAILSIILFLSVVSSTFFVMQWVEYQSRLVPRLEGYASFTWLDNTTAEIVFVVRVTAGSPVAYRYILLPTEQGLLNITGPGTYTVGQSTLNVSFNGFNGTIYVGQEARVIIDAGNASDLFTAGKLYRAILVLDWGGVPLPFRP